MKKVLYGLGVVAWILTVWAGSAWCAQPAKVLVLPPVLHGNPDMAFIQQGVVDMLTTRLAATDRLKVLAPHGEAPQAAKNQADAVAAGRALGADYVVFGSLTLLGGGISTDLRMVVPADDSLALSFSRSGKDQAALISHMDQFAAQVNQKVLGGAPAPAVPAAPVAPKAGQSEPSQDTIYQHPEKLLTSPEAAVQQVPAGQVPSGSGFVTAGKLDTVRGPRIKDQVQGIALGDLTGDGRLECVCVGLHDVYVYRNVGDGRFARMAHIKGTGNYVGVDTADLDGDGRAEIFVTNVDNSDGQVLSFVLAYNGRTFERRAEKLDYYFRSIKLSERGRVLLGQRSGIDEFFASGIYEIEYQDGRYQPVTRWKIPRELNIFGVGTGVFSPGDEGQLVAFSKSRFLQLLSASGKLVWKSSDSFGGTSAMIQRGDEDNQETEAIHFVGARIETVDVDGDGVDEVVVMHNEDATGSVLSRTRYFRKGRMEILKAGTIGLMPYWHTPDMAKYVSDFAVADLDGDGKVEIVAATVLQTDGTLTSGQSQIYIFSIGKKTAEAQQQ